MNRSTIEVDGATITILPRTNNTRYWRDYVKSPRMYVSVADETVFDNLANRKRRPYNVYKTLIQSSGIGEVLNLDGLRWSQKAGCTMCPCSPGFILNDQSFTTEDGNSVYRFDVWVTLHGAPAVDERKAPRVLAGV
jgi:hypothetical protein